ncbi:MAG: extracellular solute-binding protein [Oscillospiraceae bacterium]|nr:extracellular solute-binding protein [Oscillospiraceae bacterium]
MKKILALVLALVMVAALCACGQAAAPAPASSGSAPASSDAAPAPADAAPAEEPAAESAVTTSTIGNGPVVINLYSFTDEVPKMVARYAELHPEFANKYTVKVTIQATTDGGYQIMLDQALATGGADAPDIYCAESAFVMKYTSGDASSFAGTYKDLGIDVDNMIKAAEIAPYSVEIGSRDGEVVALAYQATGGAFIYRRSIAKDVWGSDDPAVVEEKIGAGTQSWDKFWDAAEDLKAKGYAIVSGDGDIWHAIENSSDTPWVVDGKLNIDPKREAFLDMSLKLKENNYHNETQDWQDAWYGDMKGAGEKGVLGFYGPAWLINYVMAGNSGGTKPGEGTYGDWAACAPNVGFLWGGTWLVSNKAVAGTDKAAGVAEILTWITLDTSEDGLQYGWANGTWSGEQGTKDTVASNVVMKKSDGTLDFLGGQNMFDVFTKANDAANGRVLTQYDETINNWWRDQVRQYVAGNVTRDEAIANFKMQVADNLDVIVD